MTSLVVHGIVKKQKIRHIFGFISPNSLKLCRLGQSTKLNSILVLDMVARTTDWFPGLFYLNMNFSNFGHSKYFCFVLYCPVAL